MGAVRLKTYQRRKAKATPANLYILRDSPVLNRIIALLCNDVPYEDIAKAVHTPVSHVLYVAQVEGLMSSVNDVRRQHAARKSV